MEPKWLTYLRETNPIFYEEYKKDSGYSIKWRDSYIKTLEDVLHSAASEDIEGCYSKVTKWADDYRLRFMPI